MTRRSRAVSYGSAVVLVLVGGACAALISGATGQILAIALIVVGLGVALWLARARRTPPESGLSETEAEALGRLAKDEPDDTFGPKIGREEGPRVT